MESLARQRTSSPEEQQLIARANRGDREALEQLYRQHRDWVTGLALRFTGSRDDAVDVLQETFTYLYAKFPGFKLTSSMRSFLYPVVKHHSISVLRRRRGVVDLEGCRAGDGTPRLQWLAVSHSTGDLERMVARLPEGQREVVWLRFGLDFRLAEIAETLAIPVGTVKSRLHNALLALRKIARREELLRQGGPR